MSTALTFPLNFGVGDVLPWVSWAGRNYDSLPALLDAVSDVGEAPRRPVPKWAAIKQVGDIGAPIIEDSPLFTQQVFTGDLDATLETEALKFRDGKLLQRFLEALPTIITILTTLKPLIS